MQTLSVCGVTRWFISIIESFTNYQNYLSTDLTQLKAEPFLVSSSKSMMVL